jgi:hypothetical protein
LKRGSKSRRSDLRRRPPMAMPKERWCSLPRAGALCLGLDAIRDESKGTQSLRLAVVGVKNTQGINVPAVRMIAALGARNVVVYGGDESVVYGSTSSCPPYTTHRSHTIPPLRLVACCVAACVKHAGTLRRALTLHVCRRPKGRPYDDGQRPSYARYAR